VFVFAEYIDKAAGTVSARRLNLRGGPGENYSILGRLQKGDPVKVIGTRGNWLEIEAPTGAYAFIAAQYLHQEEPPTTIADAGKPVEPKTAEEPAVTPATTTSVTEAPPVAAAPSDVPSTAGGTNDTTAAGADNNAATETAPAEEASEEPLPPRIVQREGVVRGTLSIQAPTRYELWDPTSRRVINYLYANPADLVDLSRYKGLRLIVTGEEALDERWRNTPVLTVQGIVVLQE
jgi:hypothetical protein